MAALSDLTQALQLIKWMHENYETFEGNKARCRLLCDQCFVYEQHLKKLHSTGAAAKDPSLTQGVKNLKETIAACQNFIRKYGKAGWKRFCLNAVNAKKIEQDFADLNQRLMSSSLVAQFGLQVEHLAAMEQQRQQAVHDDEKCILHLIIEMLRTDTVNKDQKIDELIANQQFQHLQTMQQMNRLLEHVGVDRAATIESTTVMLMQEAMDDTAGTSTTEAASSPTQGKGSTAAMEPSALDELKKLIVDSHLLQWDKSDASVLGRGASTTVYAGVYGRTAVAVKHFEIHGEGITETQCRRILREVKILNLASHPYVVASFGFDFNKRVLLMERAECSLSDLLYAPRRAPPSVLPMSLQFKPRAMLQVSYALNFLHFRDVLHRDVKPANILLVKSAEGDYDFKLADLGIARAAGLTALNTMKSNGGAAGTDLYKAPELLDFEGGRPLYSKACDMFALATTINELFVGERPWTTPDGDVLSIAQITRKVCDREERPQLWHASNAVEKALQEQLVGDRSKGCWAQKPHVRVDIKSCVELLKQLLTEASVSFSAEHQQALDAAVDSEDADEMQKLLQIYIDDAAKAEWKKEYGDKCWSMLHIACSCNDIRSIVLILDKGAIIDVKDKDGETPLHRAAISGHNELVEVLLARDAAVDVQNNLGWTPLHYAAYKGHSEVVKLLLAHDAAVDVKNNDRYTPLHLAAGHGRNEVVKLLLVHHAPMNMQDNYGTTPLHIAAGHGHKEVVKLLLDRGAAVDVKDKDGDTPLHVAVSDGHYEVVKLLLAHGAAVNVRNKDGDTPLHVASSEGQTEIIKLLESVSSR